MGLLSHCDPKYNLNRINLPWFFNYLNEDLKRYIIFHELGHCLFNYHHNNTGIMRYDFDYKKLDETIIEEFFSGENQRNLPTIK